MTISIIKFGLTKNTGNYESERIDAEYQVAEGECPVEAMEKLKKFVATGTMEEAPKKEEKPKKKAPAKKKEEAPKKEAPKAELYNRELKSHTSDMAKLLDEVCPEWKSDIPKAKQLSVDLNGEEFRNKKGEILDSFKEKVIKEMVQL